MKFTPTSELLNVELKQITKRYSKQSDGYSSGYPDLDQSLSGGFEVGKLYCIGSNNGVGRTMVALNILVKQLKNIAPKDVLVFVSTGTSRPVILQKILAIALEIDLIKIQSGNLSEEELSKLNRDPFVNQLKSNQLVIIEDRSASLIELEEVMNTLIADGFVPKMLFIDQIQDMQYTDKTMNREQAVYKLLKDIKVMALQVGVPVLFTSKVNKRVHYRKDSKIPQLNDLLDSRLIGDISDYCFMVLRPSFYQVPVESDAEGFLEELHLVCKKNQNLPLDTIVFSTELKKHLIVNAPNYTIKELVN
jgi:replicative DNA helicase